MSRSSKVRFLAVLAAAFAVGPTVATAESVWRSDVPAGPSSVAPTESSELARISGLHATGAGINSGTQSKKGEGKDAEASPSAGNVRAVTQRQEALSFGARAGLAWRYQQIEKTIAKAESRLDVVFNFGPLLIDDLVLPPVISRIENSIRAQDANTARSVRVGYRIDAPARIVTVTPNWRDFLYKRFQSPEDPTWVILPKDDQEAALWSATVKQGWQLGIRQADTIYDASLALLTRSYRGMLVYRELLSQGIVRAPVLARTDAGIVISGNSLNVGDVVYRITAASSFEGDASKWVPALRDESPVVQPN